MWGVKRRKYNTEISNYMELINLTYRLEVSFSFEYQNSRTFQLKNLITIVFCTIFSSREAYFTKFRIFFMASCLFILKTSNHTNMLSCWFWIISPKKSSANSSRARMLEDRRMVFPNKTSKRQRGLFGEMKIYFLNVAQRL